MKSILLTLMVFVSFGAFADIREERLAAEKKANAEKSANSQAGGPLFDQKGKPTASAKKPRRKKTVPK